jgi:hypothetical protein
MIEQDKNWNGYKCTRTDCYWNMWFPTQFKGIDYSAESSEVCISESLDEIKMQPNTNRCPGYTSYEGVCGHQKGE